MMASSADSTVLANPTGGSSDLPGFVAAERFRTPSGLLMYPALNRTNHGNVCEEHSPQRKLRKRGEYASRMRRLLIPRPWEHFTRASGHRVGSGPLSNRNENSDNRPACLPEANQYYIS